MTVGSHITSLCPCYQFNLFIYHASTTVRSQEDTVAVGIQYIISTVVNISSRTADTPTQKRQGRVPWCAAKAGVGAGKMETVVDENAAMVLQGPQSREVILAVVAVEARLVAAVEAAGAQVVAVIAVGVAEEGDVSGHAGDALLGVGEHNTSQHKNEHYHGN